MKFLLSTGLLIFVCVVCTNAKELQISFDIQAGPANRTLKEFAAQSNAEIVYDAETIGETRTSALRGSYTVADGLAAMLDGGPLFASQDPDSRAFAIRRRPQRQSADPDQSKPTRPVSSVNLPRSRRSGDEVVTLTPFDVDADKDNTYGALNSNSITGFNVELNKLPISADIFNEQFMDDMGVSSVDSMIMSYSAGAGLSTTLDSTAQTQPGDVNADSSIQTRGLATPSYQRDGFLPLQTYSTSDTTGSGYTSNFDVERVEVIKGPQSLLYGSGGGAGVINMVSKRARFDSPESGKLMFQVDQYGNKHAQLDVGEGTSKVAVRFAALDEHIGARRLNIGGPVSGEYLQLAVHAFKTDFRISLEQTHYLSFVGRAATLTATGDARTGESLDYILASNQVAAPSTGANTAGVIDNGLLNFSNVDSLAGQHGLDWAHDSFIEFTADTEWTPTLSTQLAVGYKDYLETYHQDTVHLVAPNVSTNPYPGQWAVEVSNAALTNENDRTGRTKAIRYSVVHDSDLPDVFGQKAHMTTVIGADFWRLNTSYVQQGYDEIDGSGQLVTPLVQSPINYFYPASNGPIEYSFYNPNRAVTSYQGINYARQVLNPPNAALVGPSNPLGVNPSGGAIYYVTTLNRGIYADNNATFFDGKLETLMGFRLAGTSQQILDQGGSSTPLYVNIHQANKFNYQAGANYELFPWLRPYIEIGTSYNPNFSHGSDPYGNYPTPSTALGEEVGLKFAVGDKVSGSLAWYHDNSKNELYSLTSALVTDINPIGLNGRNGAASGFVNVDRVVNGVEALFTGAPLPNLRSRLSAAWTSGSIGTSNVYAQLYNDQFHENSNGQVTYADGTVVYVPATFNSKQLTVSSTTPGAVPLTVNLLSSPTSAYYTSPLAVTGNILATSPGGLVLQSSDPVHGKILTGATGLADSDYQLNTGLTGIVPVGTIAATESGDETTGYGVWSFSFTNLYTISSGWLKGLKFGGTYSAAWDVRGFYYYPSTVTPGSSRVLFMRPQISQFDGIFGYEFKLWRLQCSTQLNISNMFNHYRVIVQPGPVGGYTVQTTRAVYWSGQPRDFVWTNTIKF